MVKSGCRLFRCTSEQKVLPLPLFAASASGNFRRFCIEKNIKVTVQFQNKHSCTGFTTDSANSFPSLYAFTVKSHHLIFSIWNTIYATREIFTHSKSKYAQVLSVILRLKFFTAKWTKFYEKFTRNFNYPFLFIPLWISIIPLYLSDSSALFRNSSTFHVLNSGAMAVAVRVDAKVPLEQKQKHIFSHFFHVTYIGEFRGYV